MHKLLFGAGLAIAMVVSAQVNAQTPQPSGPPCEGSPWWVETEATYADFDFWVGEWHVYDAESGELRGFDDIEKDLGGCVISQHWRQMDDNFAPPGAVQRLQGKSVSGLNADGQWRQVWLDNGGGNLVFTGGMVDGVMTITSEWYSVPTPNGPVTIRNIWNWRPVGENEIENWGFVERQGSDAEPRQYFNIVYRRSALGGPAADMRGEAQQTEEQ